MPRTTLEEEQEFEDLSSYSSADNHNRKRKSKKGNLAVLIVLAVVSVLLIAAGALMIYISTNLVQDLSTTTITKDPEELGISAAAIMDDSVTNIALFGVDARNDDFSGQSDVIMILTVDNKHSKLKLTSILRDTRVPIEGETLDGGYIDESARINAAYDEGGPELAIRTLNRNFGLNIKNYVTVNFAHMAAIVDAFGGVDVDLTSEEVLALDRNLWNLSQEVLRQAEADREKGEERKYPLVENEDYIRDIAGGLDLEYGAYQEGRYHLNGNQAVAYGRIRDVGDDYARVDRQQEVFTLLIGRLLDMGVTDYPSLIQSMMPHCETSMQLSDVVSLTPILFNSFTVETIKVPDLPHETDLYDGQAEDGAYYLEYDISEAAKRISSFIYEEASPYWEEYGNTGLAASTGDSAAD